MRRTLGWLVLGAALVGCTSSTTGDDAVTDDTDEDTDTDTDDSADTVDPCEDPPTGPGGTAVLSGTVVDTSGAPVGLDRIDVRFCNGATCIPAQAFDCDGNYGLYDLPLGTGTIEVLPLSDDSDLATFVSVLPIEEGTARTIDLVVPEYTSEHALRDVAAEYEVAPGFFLTVATTDLERPSPLDPVATHVRGVDATASGAAIMEGLEGTVRAVYYLGPFDYTAPGGLPVRVVDAWGLGSGGGELWVAEYAGDWVFVGDLVDDGEGDLTVSGGLPMLSTVVVLQKPQR